jgi:hypothetical protein
MSSAEVGAENYSVISVGGKVHYTMVNAKQANDHRKKVRVEAEEKLNEYVKICTRQKVLLLTSLMP